MRSVYAGMGLRVGAPRWLHALLTVHVFALPPIRSTALGSCGRRSVYVAPKAAAGGASDEKAKAAKGLPSGLKLVFGAGGIYAAFLYYGTLQEDVFKYKSADGAKFESVCEYF